ncbi:hypothetical protein [uncultured Sphingomonas sp.]|uniref:hypothetical protein n=1 Tax=uncultured Sphingomonas sp. TaxID=158754 RepID=UPI0035CAF47F
MISDINPLEESGPDLLAKMARDAHRRVQEHRHDGSIVSLIELRHLVQIALRWSDGLADYEDELAKNDIVIRHGRGEAITRGQLDWALGLDHDSQVAANERR